MVESIWRAQVEIKEREHLQGDCQVETVVIGAGLAGILTAYFLQRHGHKVILLEAKRVCSGQTGNTTAKITSQHGMCYDRLIRKAGRERALGYACANEEAIRLYEQLIREEGIDCRFERKPAYLYTRRRSAVEELKKEAQAAKELGIKAHYVDGKEIKELPFSVAGAVCFENQAQFHPLAFVTALVNRLEIYEDTKVLSVNKHEILTNRGKVTAQNIVFAVHYPFLNVPGFYFLRQHQERSYVLALQGAGPITGMYYGIDEDGLSFRDTGHVLLLGGGGHRTGKIKCSCKSSREGYGFLRKMAGEYMPQAQELGAWSAQDCMPHDGIPFIGKYSIMRPYWYVASGFQKWGMTTAMIAARIIADQICGCHAAYEEVFTPQRFLFRAGIRNFLVDLGESVMGLGKGLFSQKKRRCPHMGCRLEWNGEEKSWDCPCHGSRFESSGELIDNPAQMDR